MKIDRKEAARIAALSHLEFEGDSLDRIASELTTILEYVDQLKEVATEAVDEPHARSMALREDLPSPPLERADVEANAPRFIHGFFIVPKVIGGEP